MSADALSCAFCDTPLGELSLLASGDGLAGASFSRPPDSCRHEETALLRRARAWFGAYFAGERPEAAALPQDARGTPFQRSVWALLGELGWGRTTTYGALAARLALVRGRAVAAQAVGQAVGANPLVILVPCHRVLGAGGRLTGYAEGLWRKERLLEHEGASWRR